MEIVQRKKPTDYIRHNNRYYEKSTNWGTFSQSREVIGKRTGKSAIAVKSIYGWAVYEPVKQKCAICGKEIDDETCFEYEDEFGVKRAVSDLCCNPKCVDEYADKYGDAEPNIDYEEVWQRQQDDLWEQEELF